MRTDDTDRTPDRPPGPSAANASLDEFFVTCYEEVHVIARRELQKERPGHTLQTTDLVHEVYERLRKSRSLLVNDRIHFIAIAARAVRRHLLDAARKRNAQKEGGKLVRVTLVTDAVDGHEPFQPDLIALGRAMEQLEKLHERQAWVIDMRFIGGLSVDETASKLGVSERTVKEDSRAALAFLRREVSRFPRPL